jgi:hypothetical protein
VQHNTLELLAFLSAAALASSAFCLTIAVAETRGATSSNGLNSTSTPSSFGGSSGLSCG